jgi:hypothetical protein
MYVEKLNAFLLLPDLVLEGAKSALRGFRQLQKCLFSQVRKDIFAPI